MKFGRLLAAVMLMCMTLALTGCGSDDVPVMLHVIDNQSYTTKEALEEAVQPDQIDGSNPVYASIYFVESPKGTEYTAVWSVDGKEIYREDQQMVEDKCGVLIYTLENPELANTDLKLQINQKDHIAYETTIKVK